MIPCAVGGTKLERWEAGGDLAAAAVAACREAEASGGVLRGVLWHHGESDAASEQLAATYGERLPAALTALREKLGRPDLPIVVAGPADWLDPARYPHRRAVADAVNAAPGKLKRVAVVDTAGLGDGGDRTHMSAASARQLGRRFAAAVAQLE